MYMYGSFPGGPARNSVDERASRVAFGPVAVCCYMSSTTHCLAVLDITTRKETLVSEIENRMLGTSVTNPHIIKSGPEESLAGGPL